MLDKETKDRINTARDILVGKVPDPKSQVEQITIALIYKFMDDMDAESEELGGNRKFFTGKYAKYGWRKIFNPKLGGHEMLQLYSDAIQQMNLIPTIPQLFRDIFKNAYLPYRDPETLKSFLKIINEFHYDHSEKLGDAFEYLLSVLGSQGDAGQFRTPRHIIDFVVKLVDPKKTERILDPACGTAGFLISAYKHILNSNAKDGKPGKGLTPTEKKNLADNFRGYDISPDMVRMSLANMYLHGFPLPGIYEYDTLTSEDRWNEYYDVILANPPFMSPKGGIRPHKRFGVQSNRSEVLFVDYIAEHLSPNGRAAIIVPEGIIFQSGNAYKQLRKMLVEEYLVAVVSLPAGVFNPYSGVKTSVLVMDKALAKKTKDILFVKISNDGFDLGAQRREIDKNDLGEAESLIKEYMASIAPACMPEKTGTNNSSGIHAGDDNARQIKRFSPTTLASVVSKKKIAANGEYNLSADRYKENTVLTLTAYEILSIGETCDLMTGGTPTSSINEYYQDGDIKWLVSGDIHKGEIFDCEGRITQKGMKNCNAKLLPINSVLIALNGQGKTRGTVAILRTLATCNQSLVSISPRNKQQLSPDYLYYLLKTMYADIRSLTGENERSGLNMNLIRSIKFPLPPLSIQQQIVSEIEAYQKVIDGAKQVVENYKPVIHINPEWEMVELSTVCEIISGYSFGSGDFSPNNQIQSIKITNVGVQQFITTEGDYLPKKYQEKYSKFIAKTGDIAIALTRTIIDSGIKIALVPDGYDKSLINQRVAVVRCNNKVINKFVYSILLSPFAVSYIEEKARSLMQPNLSVKDLASLKIPLPSLEEQHYIVQQLETERKLVESNKKLIELMQAKIKAAIARVWGTAEKKEHTITNKSSAKTKKMYEGNESVRLVAEE